MARVKRGRLRPAKAAEDAGGRASLTGRGRGWTRLADASRRTGGRGDAGAPDGARRIAPGAAL